LLLYSRSMSLSLLPSFLSFVALLPSVIYTLSLHDALPIWSISSTTWPSSSSISSRRAAATSLHRPNSSMASCRPARAAAARRLRSEEHTSELQSLRHLVCRLLLENTKPIPTYNRRCHDKQV